MELDDQGVEIKSYHWQETVYFKFCKVRILSIDPCTSGAGNGGSCTEKSMRMPINHVLKVGHIFVMKIHITYQCLVIEPMA